MKNRRRCSGDTRLFGRAWWRYWASLGLVQANHEPQFSMARRHLLILFPGNVMEPSGVDARNCLRVYLHVRSLTPTDAVNFTSLGPHSRMKDIIVAAFVGERFLLLRHLFREKGTVYTTFVPFAAACIIYKIVFHMSYRIVAVIYGRPDWGFLNPTYRLLAALVMKSVDGVVYSSEAETASLVVRFAKRKINIPPVLIDPKEWESWDQSAPVTLPALRGKKLVGIIGPFVGTNELAIDYLEQHVKEFLEDIVFVLVGSYDRNKHRATEKLVFVGYRKDDFMGIIKSLNCVLIPRIVTTGSPMTKMVVAMAAGVPVVTNTSEGMNIKPGRDAIVGKLEELPRLTNELLSSPEKAKLLGANGRKFVKENYLTETHMERLTSFLMPQET